MVAPPRPVMELRALFF
jgi:hypothetical protein